MPKTPETPKTPEMPKPLFKVGDRVQDKKTRIPYTIEYTISKRVLSEFSGRWEYKLHDHKRNLKTQDWEIVGESDWIEQHKLKKNTEPAPDDF